MSVINRIAAAAARSKMITAVRKFFLEKAYLEIESPVLAPARIPESHIELFRSVFKNTFTKERDLYLLPSPELWMKRLLSEGFPSCFQISKCFRNAEQIGAHHNPEFSMLEWYTVDADYLDSYDLTRELLDCLGPVFPEDFARGLSSIKRISMHELFLEHTGIDLCRCSTLPGLIAEAAEQGIETAGAVWEEAFNKIFLQYAEPELAQYPAVFLYDYPIQIPCLAKVKLAKAGKEIMWRERWELYLHGMEIANCYTEETDPKEVGKFIAGEGEGGAHVPGTGNDVAEQQGFADLCASMPSCSGVALGVDRLLMALTGKKRIEDVLLFPFSEF
jgi:elongation factor P--(R)-beta-lysine ligase